MSHWAICEGEKHRKKIELESWRVVEAQHVSSSRDLVDSIEEHDRLEELLEKSKPTIAIDKHYLIFTPFRYPPLKYGSRFGRPFEPSLWYGSMDLQTAFAEVAFYRLKFFDDTSANLGFSEIPITAFNTYLKSNNGIDLTEHPFTNHQNKISNTESYEYSQALGTDMRQAGIEAFIFTSARATHKGKNIRPLSKLAAESEFMHRHGAENRSVHEVHEDSSTVPMHKFTAAVEFRKKSIGAFTPDVFIKRDNQYISDMQTWQCLTNKNSIEFTRIGITTREKLSFFKEDFGSF